MYCFCQWLITVVVVHITSFEDAGYLSLAMTTSSSFSAIALFNMRNYQISDVKGEYSCDVYVGSRITTCLIAFACCSIASWGGNSTYQWLCIEAFMLVRIAEALIDVLHGENQKFERYDYIGKSYIIRGLLTLFSFAFGLLLTKNLMLTLFVMAGCNLLAAIFYDWGRTSKLEAIQPVIWSPQVSELLKKCFPIVLFAFLLSLENLIPKNLLQQIFGTEQLGIYSTIASPTLIVQVFASVAFNPLIPRLSSAYYANNYDRFLNMLRKTYVALLVLCVVATGGAVAVGRIGLRILFGRKILEYYSLFMPIVWVTILTAIIWVVSAIVIAIRQIKWLLIGIGIDFLICIGLARPFIEMFGSNGVSIVQIVSYSVYIIFLIGVCEITLVKKRRSCYRHTTDRI